MGIHSRDIYAAGDYCGFAIAFLFQKCTVVNQMLIAMFSNPEYNIMSCSHTMKSTHYHWPFGLTFQLIGDPSGDRGGRS